MLQKYPILICWALILGLGLWYGYPSILDKRPQSVHQWRQTDGACIGQNYHNDGLQFSEPRISQMLGNNGKGVGELPVLYYTAAALSGTHWDERILRGLHLAIFLMGLAALFGLVRRLTESDFYGLFVVGLVFTSPLLAYYGNNFLPDTPALGLMWMASYSWVRWRKDQQLFWLIAFLPLMSLALCIKSSTVFFLPLLAVATEAHLSDRIDLKQLILRKLPMGIPVFVMIAWVLWAKSYNEASGNGYFLLGTTPVWTMDWVFFKRVTGRLLRDWIPVFQHWPVHAFVLGCFAWVAIGRRSATAHRFAAWTGFSCMAILTVLFYDRYYHHDYYGIVPFYFASWILVLVHPLLYKLATGRRWLFLLAGAALFLSAFFTRGIVRDRYAPEDVYVDFFELSPLLNEWGIPADAPVVSIPDQTPNVSLYLMNRKGYTQFYFGKPIEADELHYLRKSGVSYLVVDERRQPELGELSASVDQLIGRHERVAVYSLLPAESAN